MWKFKVYYKNVFRKRCRSEYFEYDAELLTWAEAWHKCVNEALAEVGVSEVIASVHSVNDIAVRGKHE